MSATKRLKKSFKKSVMQQLHTERVRLKKNIMTVAKQADVNPAELDTAETTGSVSWGVLIKLLDYYNKKLAIKVVDKE